MNELIKTAPKAPAKASRVNVGVLMDRCLAPFKIVHRFEAEFALMKKHSRYADDSFAFFDSSLKTKTPEQIAAARAALVEIIGGIDEKAAYEGFSELLEANKNTDERLIRGLIGVMLDVLAGKEAETNATYIDTMVWMISGERYDRYQVPAAAVAAAVRDIIASETFRPPISDFIKRVKTHHRTLCKNWHDMSYLRMAPGHAEECLDFLDDPTLWDQEA